MVRQLWQQTNQDVPSLRKQHEESDSVSVKLKTNFKWNCYAILCGKHDWKSKDVTYHGAEWNLHDKRPIKDKDPYLEGERKQVWSDWKKAAQNSVRKDWC